jgi:hypothetical protein
MHEFTNSRDHKLCDLCGQERKYHDQGRYNKVIIDGQITSGELVEVMGLLATEINNGDISVDVGSWGRPATLDGLTWAEKDVVVKLLGEQGIKTI